MRFVFRFNVSLNQLSSLFNAIYNGHMSLDGEMVKGTSDNQDDLPFKEPEDVSTIKSDVVEGEEFQSIPEPVIAAAPGTGDLSVLPSQEQDSKNIETINLNSSAIFSRLWKHYGGLILRDLGNSIRFFSPSLEHACLD